MTNEEKQRKKRIAAGQSAGGAMFNWMHGKSSSNNIAKTFNASAKEAKEYKPKVSNFSSSKNSKAKGSQTSPAQQHKKDKVQNDKQKSSKTSSKSKVLKKSDLKKLRKSASGLFQGKKPTKPVKYGNIRVKQHVVDDLHSLQEITNNRSRSDLLDKMIDLTKQIVLTNSTKKKKYNENIEHYKTIRHVK